MNRPGHRPLSTGTGQILMKAESTDGNTSTSGTTYAGGPMQIQEQVLFNEETMSDITFLVSIISSVGGRGKHHHNGTHVPAVPGPCPPLGDLCRRGNWSQPFRWFKQKSCFLHKQELILFLDFKSH